MSNFHKALIVILTVFCSLLYSPVRGDDAPGRATLESLLSAAIPARDRIDLARRLLSVTSIPPPPATPIDYNVGDRLSFTVVRSEDSAIFDIEAVLSYETPHVYMWFENRYTPDAAAVRLAAEYFESRIYPTVHRYFGTEESPGIDGDVHLYIVHAYDLGSSVAAYYWGDSELPVAVSPNSNEHQMFFVNLDALSGRIGTPYYHAVLAHEFQHMVHSHIDPNEQVWLDEGMAELAAALSVDSFGLGFAPDFLRKPATQLNNWNPIRSSGPNYGGSYLFAAYFLQRYGEDALRLLIHNPLDGLPGVTNTLQQIGASDGSTGHRMTAEYLFADWTLANWLNDPSIDGTRYGYTNLQAKLPKPASARITVGMPQEILLSQWGTTYLTLDEPGSYRLAFNGAPTVRVIPTEAEDGKMFWWGNRSEEMDTRLTRRFDLTAVTSATLQFRTWFATERDWDFAYVMVSDDEGLTWKTLPLPAGSAGAGGNNFYGYGYTGISGGWIDQQIDLGSYAGKNILLRFEYITDAAINEPGIAIDDIRIPEIGYFTDAESDDGGWTAEGWVRIDNVLPQPYLVQLVHIGDFIGTERLLTQDSGISGTWDFEIGGDVNSIVLTISGLTEFTTEQSTASYSVLIR